MRRLDNVRTIVFGKAKGEGIVAGILPLFPVYRFGSGREALFALLQSRVWPNKTVLLPAFLPEGVYYPFARSGWQIVFYEMDEYGNPEFEDLPNRIAAQTPAIAVLIHLFGVVRDAARFKQNLPDTCLFIEDFAHSTTGRWLDGYQLIGDMALFSPPKLLGVVDGCELLCKEKSSWKGVLRGSPVRSFYLVLRTGALLLATAADRWGHADASNVLDALAARCYNWAYRIHMLFCQKPHTFSRLGRWMLAHTPVETIADKRLGQAILYQQGLNNAHIRSLYDTRLGAIPIIGFPIKLTDRPHFEHYLHKQGISGAAYAPKWWFLSDEATLQYPRAYQLWASHYVLPVNQKLSNADIQRVIAVVNRYQPGD